MARKKSELLSSLGTVFEIVKAIIDEVLDLGGSDEDVRRILKDKSLRKKIANLIVQTKPAIQDTFKVVVDYGQSLAEMISAGKYGWVNSDIIQKHFPVEGSDQKEVELVLFHFGRVMTSEQVIAEMDEAGYRPAPIEDLLSLGASYPELQKDFPVAALGSVWQSPVGHRYVPYLPWCGVRRDLNLYWFGPDWPESYRFAAVRK